jgi:hypothetical protein
VSAATSWPSARTRPTRRPSSGPSCTPRSSTSPRRSATPGARSPCARSPRAPSCRPPRRSWARSRRRARSWRRCARSPSIEPRFSGQPDDVVAQAEAIFRQQRALTLPQLMAFPRATRAGRSTRDAPRSRPCSPPSGTWTATHGTSSTRPTRTRPATTCGPATTGRRPARQQGRRAGEGAGAPPARRHQAGAVRRPHRHQPAARLRAAPAGRRLAVGHAQRQLRRRRARARRRLRPDPRPRLHRRGAAAHGPRDARVPRLLQPRPRAVQAAAGQARARRGADDPRGAGRQEAEPRRPAHRARQEVVRLVSVAMGRGRRRVAASQLVYAYNRVARGRIVPTYSRRTPGNCPLGRRGTRSCAATRSRAPAACSTPARRPRRIRRRASARHTRRWRSSPARARRAGSDAR